MMLQPGYRLVLRLGGCHDACRAHVGKGRDQVIANLRIVLDKKNGRDMGAALRPSSTLAG